MRGRARAWYPGFHIPKIRSRSKSSRPPALQPFAVFASPSGSVRSLTYETKHPNPPSALAALLICGLCFFFFFYNGQ